MAKLFKHQVLLRLKRSVQFAVEKLFYVNARRWEVQQLRISGVISTEITPNAQQDGS
jgi:hypothetical protein